MNQTHARNSKHGALLNIKNLGFYPNFVVDVGANDGTHELYEVFPESQHIMIEPMVEYESKLAEICSRLPNAIFIIAGAAEESGTATLMAFPESHSSGIVPDNEPESERGEKRTINCVTLDELVEMRELKGPGLIKIDVDGLEVEVLKGSIEALKCSEYVVIEAALFFRAHEIISFMESQNFVIYDIVDNLYRPLDNALWQVDIAFVKKDGIFRQSQSWG